MRNWKIGVKIGFIVGVLALSMTLNSVISGYFLKEGADHSREIADAGDAMMLSARFNRLLVTLNRAEYRLAANPADFDEVMTTIPDYKKQVQDILTELKSEADPEQARLLAQIEVQYAAYLKELDDVINVARKHKNSQMSPETAEIYAQVVESRTAADKVMSSAKALTEYSDKKSEETSTETLQAARHAILINIVIGAISLIVGIVMGTLTSRKGIVQPLNSVVSAMGRLMKGELDHTIPETDRHDEIGDIARVTQHFQQMSVEQRNIEVREKEELAKREERAIRVDGLTKSFDTMIVGMIGKIKNAIEHLHNSADSLSANAEQTQRQSSAVAAATEEATTNVQTVSSASVELTASIHEISSQVNSAADIAKAATAEASEARDKISGLYEATQRVGQIVGMIQSIASQTNMLALNATIESARAGEAGKGFAVVAHEVKSLAGQTGQATQDITSQITAIQDETSAAVTAIEGISRTIDRIFEVSTVVAGAVEEQGAATQEIARNVEQASQGTQEVASNIVGVAQAARETGQMAQILFTAANDLLAQSDSLEREVETFLRDMRAA